MPRLRLWGGPVSSREGELAPHTIRMQSPVCIDALARLAVIHYSDGMAFTRITIDPAVCTGKPCIRGLRFPVARLLGLMAAGETREAILRSYPYIESGDIDEALRYAAFLAEDETVELLPSVPAK
jgi:uncharacterized protein (DUF433 family)